MAKEINYKDKYSLTNRKLKDIIAKYEKVKNESDILEHNIEFAVKEIDGLKENFKKVKSDLDSYKKKYNETTNELYTVNKVKNAFENDNILLNEDISKIKSAVEMQLNLNYPNENHLFLNTFDNQARNTLKLGFSNNLKFILFIKDIVNRII